MSDELKACECGGNVSTYGFIGGEDRVTTGWQVSCDCGRRGPWYRTEEEAIAAWNRRTVTREQVEKMAADIAWLDYDDARMSRAGLARCILRAAGFEVAE